MRELSKLRTHILDCIYLQKFAPTFLVRRVLLILCRRRFIPFSMRQRIKFLAKSSKEKEYESVILPYMEVTNGGAFIDVGAHIGVHTKRMALKGIDVYAFEPNPVVSEILHKNVEDLPNVEVFDCALGDRNTKAKFYIHKEQPASGFGSLHNIYNRENVEEIVVKVRTLDSFNFENVGLIKVDTEGNEFNVLKGVIRTLREQKPRLILEVHEPMHKWVRLITNLLSELGYHNIKHVCKADRDQLFIIAD